jgi:long-chain acyl-CoA synthetase
MSNSTDEPDEPDDKSFVATPGASGAFWPSVALQEENHFGDRLLRCFAERPRHLPQLLQEAHARDPQAAALADGARRWNWAALRADSGRLAHTLARLGVAAGDRVALLLGNRAEFVIATHAVLRLGAVLVPMSIREAAPGVAFILNQCRASAVLAEAGLATLVPERLDDGQALLRVCLGEDTMTPDGWLLWSDEVATQEEPTFADAAPAEDTAAVILYTSGTTGRPKGAVLTHLNLLHSVLHYRHALGLCAADRALLAVPASHVTGLVAIVLAMAGVGGAVVVLREFKAASCLAIIEREKVSYTLMVPAMYALCLLEPTWAHTDLSGWRLAGFGGAPMPPATIKALRQHCTGIGLFNAYGATETTSPVTLTLPGTAPMDSAGVALPCADVRVVDDEGHDLPAGQSGEIWIAGPMVVPRYWDNPQATADGFAGGYWKSGDIGTLDAQGFLRVHDRKKDMINRGGYKVFSVEVENCLLAHPAVREAATVGVPCPVLGERIHAFVHAPDSASSVQLQAELVALCRQQLADYKTPDAWTWLAEPLPRNPNGKVLKRALRELAVASQKPA